jgi:hypothetical protein
MARFVIRGMGGMIPRLDPGVLPDNMSELAQDCDFRSGNLDGLPQLQFVKSLPGARKAFRFPDALNEVIVWLKLPSEHSSVCRSPLTNDATRRIYWTNPGDLSPHWATYAMINDDNNYGIPLVPYDLGIDQPNPGSGGALSVTVTGGTTSVPQVARSYCYTFINDFGEESAPNYPSTIVEGPADGTWTIYGLPPPPPAGSSGRNYPFVRKVRLYRTVTGLQTGASFYMIVDFLISPDPYVDVSTDLQIIDNPTLISTSWGNPPDHLDGLVALPGGMMVGFTGNTIHFCEPYRPHAWPAIYDQSVLYDIVALTAWNQSLAILTAGFISAGTGNSPANYIINQTQVAEPCISRGSVVTDLQGVIYSSQNGLVKTNYFQADIISLDTMSKDTWLESYHGDTIFGARHRAQYIAIHSDGGFIFDGTDNKAGFVLLNTVDNATSIWNDEFEGNTYVMIAGNVYLWDSPTAAHDTYQWKSKQFYAPAPISLGAVHVTSSPRVDDAMPSDPSGLLPDGVHARFRIFSGPALTLIMERDIQKSTDIFRLPSGFRAFDWQIELIGRVRIDSVELASTMKELQGV